MSAMMDDPGRRDFLKLSAFAGGGRVQQGNFHEYRLLRLPEAPAIEVKLLASEEAPGGIGEPSTALVAPAVCNAIFAATGRRLRELPIAKALPA